MAVIDRPLAKAPARMLDPRALAADDRHRRRAGPHHQIQPAQRVGTE